MRAAISRIRSLPSMNNVPIVFIPENAPGMAGAYLWEHINDLEPIMVMEEFGSRSRSGRSQPRVGVPKTWENTEDMRLMFVDLLASKRVRISQRFVSLNRDGGDGRTVAKEKLASQMRNYVPGVHKKYGEQYNDDLLIALMMSIYWRNELYKNPRYRNWLQKYVANGGVASVQ